MIRITVVLLTCATALTACGTAPTEQTTATHFPAATVLPTDLPTVLPSTVAPSAAPEATDAPTVAAATKTANLASPVQKGYVSLVLIKGIAVMLDDTAQRSQAGQLKGFEGFGRLIAIGAFYKAISENLAKDAPDPALQAGWEQARMVLPKLQNVLAQLSDKKITTADVPALTAPIHTEIDQMLDTAEAGLSAAYGTDPAKLKEIRDKAITDLQNTLSATPTPKP